MKDATNTSDICDLFTEGSHHRNLSVICLLQNMYYKGKETRTMSLNTHYMVLFKNPRDSQQVSVLARQMFPRNTQYFLNSFEEATSIPFGYLVIDLKQMTPDNARLRRHVFGECINNHGMHETPHSEEKQLTTKDASKEIK